MLQRLVDELKRRGCIRSAAVEAAFRAVPRHHFVPGVPLDDVYGDKAIPTKRSADGAFISSSSQPAIMALMLEQLELAPGHRVLEIGAGTGYNAALMAHIVGETGQVTAIDIDEDLVAGAREHLAAAGFERVRVVCGDGGLGYPDDAPYDRIILTVGASDITPGWIEQLRSGGRLLLPLSIKGPQMCVAFERADGHLESVSIEECGFMMLRGAFAGASGRIRLGEITIGIVDPSVVDTVAVAEWLTASHRDQPTGIRVKASNVFASLSHWLAFREPGYCNVNAEGEAAERGMVPALFDQRYSSVTGTVRVAGTSGVLGDQGLCLFMRPPDAPSEAEAGADVWGRPFELFLRTFGPDEALAERVIEHVKSWDAAGRPAPKELRIRVYPKEAGYRPSDGELVVDKRWSRVILDWPGGG
ncbi:MAG: methyltransferase, FxLD system [Armatimonadota bacterium]